MYHTKDWITLGTEVITVSSVLHTVLPPYGWEPTFVSDGLSDFPAAQSVFRSVFHSRWYKLLIYVIGYVAVNARSTLWRSISMSNQVGKALQEAKDNPITVTIPAPAPEVKP